MARSKKTARRPALRQLRDDLDDALGALYEVRNDGTAQASLDNATAMLRVWSLRFQLANLELDEDVENTPDADEDGAAKASRAARKNAARRAAIEASNQLGEWEKRKGVAQGDLVNDLLLQDREHTEEQNTLATAARALQ